MLSANEEKSLCAGGKGLFSFDWRMRKKKGKVNNCLGQFNVFKQRFYFKIQIKDFKIRNKNTRSEKCWLHNRTFWFAEIFEIVYFSLSGILWEILLSLNYFPVWEKPFCLNLHLTSLCCQPNASKDVYLYI